MGLEEKMERRRRQLQRLAEKREVNRTKLLERRAKPLNWAWMELEAQGYTCDKTDSDYAMDYLN
jgi:hypothetical protein